MIRLSPPERLGEFFGLYGLVGKGSQVIGQLLYGVIVFLLIDTLGNGAYQIAVVSLLVTMLIGLWLVWPVRDDWSGSGEIRAEGDEVPAVAPPERLAPVAARRSSRARADRRPALRRPVGEVRHAGWPIPVSHLADDDVIPYEARPPWPCVREAARGPA